MDIALINNDNIITHLNTTTNNNMIMMIFLLLSDKSTKQIVYTPVNHAVTWYSGVEFGGG